MDGSVPADLPECPLISVEALNDVAERRRRRARASTCGCSSIRGSAGRRPNPELRPDFAAGGRGRGHPDRALRHGAAGRRAGDPPGDVRHQPHRRRDLRRRHPPLRPRGDRCRRSRPASVGARSARCFGTDDTAVCVVLWSSRSLVIGLTLEGPPALSTRRPPVAALTDVGPDGDQLAGGRHAAGAGVLGRGDRARRPGSPSSASRCAPTAGRSARRSSARRRRPTSTSVSDARLRSGLRSPGGRPAAEELRRARRVPRRAGRVAVRRLWSTSTCTENLARLGMTGGDGAGGRSRAVRRRRPVAGHGSIRPGQQGTRVAALQIALVNVGYVLPVDGRYGPLTEAAVVDFQVRNGIDPIGIAGPPDASGVGDLTMAHGGRLRRWRSAVAVSLTAARPGRRRVGGGPAGTAPAQFDIDEARGEARRVRRRQPAVAARLGRSRRRAAVPAGDAAAGRRRGRRHPRVRSAPWYSYTAIDSQLQSDVGDRVAVVHCVASPAGRRDRRCRAVRPRHRSRSTTPGWISTASPAASASGGRPGWSRPTHRGRPRRHVLLPTSWRARRCVRPVAPRWAGDRRRAVTFPPGTTRRLLGATQGAATDIVVDLVPDVVETLIVGSADDDHDVVDDIDHVDIDHVDVDVDDIDFDLSTTTSTTSTTEPETTEPPTTEATTTTSSTTTSQRPRRRRRHVDHRRRRPRHRRRRRSRRPTTTSTTTTTTEPPTTTHVDDHDVDDDDDDGAAADDDLDHRRRHTEPPTTSTSTTTTLPPTTTSRRRRRRRRRRRPHDHDDVAADDHDHDDVAADDDVDIDATTTTTLPPTTTSTSTTTTTTTLPPTTTSTRRPRRRSRWRRCGTSSTAAIRRTRIRSSGCRASPKRSRMPGWWRCSTAARHRPPTCSRRCCPSRRRSR